MIEFRCIWYRYFITAKLSLCYCLLESYFHYLSYTTYGYDYLHDLLWHIGLTQPPTLAHTIDNIRSKTDTSNTPSHPTILDLLFL